MKKFLKKFNVSQIFKLNSIPEIPFGLGEFKASNYSVFWYLIWVAGEKNILSLKLDDLKMSKIIHRDISPILQSLRNFLLGVSLG